MAWANVHDESYSYNDDIWVEHDINWTASLRGKLGSDGGAFLPYLTAGLAVAKATSTPDDDPDYTNTQRTSAGPSALAWSSP